MAGRGPAPKLGEHLGHRSKSEKASRRRAQPTAPAVGRPLPEGDWHAQAARWWESAMRSDGVAVWDDHAWVEAERCLALVDAMWRLRDEGKLEQFMRANDLVRRQEQALYLSPVERHRAVRDGVIKPPEAAPVPAKRAAAGSSARARLRALDGGGEAS